MQTPEESFPPGFDLFAFLRYIKYVVKQRTFSVRFFTFPPPCSIIFNVDTHPSGIASPDAADLLYLEDTT